MKEQLNLQLSNSSSSFFQYPQLLFTTLLPLNLFSSFLLRERQLKGKQLQNLLTYTWFDYRRWTKGLPYSKGSHPVREKKTSGRTLSHYACNRYATIANLVVVFIPIDKRAIIHSSARPGMPISLALNSSPVISTRSSLSNQVLAYHLPWKY